MRNIENKTMPTKWEMVKEFMVLSSPIYGDFEVLKRRDKADREINCEATRKTLKIGYDAFLVSKYVAYVALGTAIGLALSK